jgi:hypothetical protein
MLRLCLATFVDSGSDPSGWAPVVSALGAVFTNQEQIWSPSARWEAQNAQGSDTRADGYLEHTTLDENKANTTSVSRVHPNTCHYVASGVTSLSSRVRGL